MELENLLARGERLVYEEAQLWKWVEKEIILLRNEKALAREKRER